MEAIYRRTPLITTTHWNQAFLVLYVWQIQTQMITQIKQKNEHYCDVEDAGRNVILRNMRKLNIKTKNKRFEPFPLKIRPNKTSDTGSGNTWPRHNFITQSLSQWQTGKVMKPERKQVKPYLRIKHLLFCTNLVLKYIAKMVLKDFFYFLWNHASGREHIMKLVKIKCPNRGHDKRQPSRSIKYFLDFTVCSIFPILVLTSWIHQLLDKVTVICWDVKWLTAEN